MMMMMTPSPLQTKDWRQKWSPGGRCLCCCCESTAYKMICAADNHEQSGQMPCMWLTNGGAAQVWGRRIRRIRRRKRRERSFFLLQLLPLLLLLGFAKIMLRAKEVAKQQRRPLQVDLRAIKSLTLQEVKEEQEEEPLPTTADLASSLAAAADNQFCALRRSCGGDDFAIGRQVVAD